MSVVDKKNKKGKMCEDSVPGKSVNFLVVHKIPKKSGFLYLVVNAQSWFTAVTKAEQLIPGFNRNISHVFADAEEIKEK